MPVMEIDILGRSKPAVTVYIVEVADSGKSTLIDCMLDRKRAERWVERFNSEMELYGRHESWVNARAYLHELSSQPAAVSASK